MERDSKLQAVLPLLHSKGNTRIITIQGTSCFDISTMITSVMELVKSAEFTVIEGVVKCDTKQRIALVIQNYEIVKEECASIIASYQSCDQSQRGVLILGVVCGGGSEIPDILKQSLIIQTLLTQPASKLAAAPTGAVEFKGHFDITSRVNLILSNMSKRHTNTAINKLAVPTGLLIVGPSGCGKTQLGRYILQRAVSEHGMHTESISATELFGKYLGETESRLRELFEGIRTASSSRKASVLFIDEIDAVGARRSDVGSSGSDAGTSSVRALSALLCELDGITQNNNLLIVAATSLPWNLDPALLRQGRFETVINIPTPQAPDRQLILQSILPSECSCDIEDVVSRTVDFVPAALLWVVKTAGRLAFVDRTKPPSIQQSHVDAALLQASPPVSSEILQKYKNFEQGVS
eukprot:TRINITY_DN36692_c0_g1_i1.p1 TRINITY_DN36692_c0_g1~~TRINITY_DN36692_c0_g1_i1.p1  ORF type:complete len:409 (+),score=67.18 TRINITY_DN36692_c0_g1_i1:35-1261(+)